MPPKSDMPVDVLVASLAYLFSVIDRMDSKVLSMNAKAYRKAAEDAREMLPALMRNDSVEALAGIDRLAFASPAAQDLMADELMSCTLRTTPAAFPELERLLSRLTNKEVQ